MIDISPQLETMIVETAKAQGISPSAFLLKAVQAQRDVPFDFDLERMQQRIDGYETQEQALKNGIEVPNWALADLQSFDKWLMMA